MLLELKSEVIQVRVTPTQATAFRERAAGEGRRVSEWLREVARREVSAATLNPQTENGPPGRATRVTSVRSPNEAETYDTTNSA